MYWFAKKYSAIHLDFPPNEHIKSLCDIDTKQSGITQQASQTSVHKNMFVFLLAMLASGGNEADL